MAETKKKVDFFKRWNDGWLREKKKKITIIR